MPHTLGHWYQSLSSKDDKWHLVVGESPRDLARTACGRAIRAIAEGAPRVRLHDFQLCPRCLQNEATAEREIYGGEPYHGDPGAEFALYRPSDPML